MIITLIGAPGSGKSTQADFIHEEFGIPIISTGNMLRAAVKEGSLLGLAAKSVMDLGYLVSDDAIINIVNKRIKERDCENGFIFDGFPRTIPQAEAIRQAGVQIDYVIEIDVDESEAIQRTNGRRVHIASGRSYHVHFNRPKEEGKDDITGEELVERSDDIEKTVRMRLDVYHQLTEPLVKYYRTWAKSGDELAPRYINIPGASKATDIRDEILAIFSPKEL
jgi:adenylate kinase